jgi:integrase
MNRHPEGKKWTIRELDTIPSEWKGDFLSDGGGLRGEVRFSNKVTINFKFQFRLKGKMCWHFCGTYPLVNMSAIRVERDWARGLVKQGIDPRVAKKAEAIKEQEALLDVIRNDEKKRDELLTFKDLFVTWTANGVARENNNKVLKQNYEKYSGPALGNIPIKHLSEDHLRDLYKSIISQGKVRTAIKLSTDISQMFKWGEKRNKWRKLLENGNPTSLVDINVLIPKSYNPVRERTLSTDEIIQLSNTFKSVAEEYEKATSKYALERPLKIESQIATWLCLGTLCRIGELLMTRWENVNFENRTWFIPEADTKDEIGDQLVFLSDFTLSQFRKLYEVTGETIIVNSDGTKTINKNKYAFPAKLKDGHICIKTVSKQIGDRQAKFKFRSRKLKNRVANNSLVLGDSEWTPHDLRRTGATLMQELGVPREIINLCLNHVVGSKMDQVYLHAQFKKQKCDAWSLLGDHLDELLRIN